MKRLLGSVFALLVGVGVLSACAGGGSLTVTARFSDAAGLFEGNDVGVLGVPVGQVVRITPAGDHVDVLLEIDDDVKIPADAGAVIVSRSVATDRYVELTPVYDAGPVLASGAVLTQTRTPVEFDQLLASLEDISADLGENGAIGDLLDVSATTLKGRGDQVAATMHDLATVLEAVNGSSGDAVATLENLDTLTSALATHDATVRGFVDQVTQATDLLNDEHTSVEATVDAMAALLRRLTAFSKEHRTAIGAQADDLTSLMAALVDDKASLEELVEKYPLMLQNAQRAAEPDGRINFRTRPTDLLPGPAGFATLCSHFPDPTVCELFEPGAATLFDLFASLAGVSG